MAVINEDFIVKSPFESKTFPKVDLWTFLQRSFKVNAAKIALIDPDEGRTLTYHQVELLVEAVAHGLHQCGYRAQRPVVICMTNCIEFVLCLLAVWRLHGTVAVVNPLLMHGEIHKQLLLAGPEFILCNDVTTEKCIKASNGTSVKHIISKEDHTGCIQFSSLYKDIGKSCSDINLPQVNPLSSVALIPFSSGTTGLPKGVELTHSALVEETTYFLHVTALEKCDAGGILYQPLSHMYGMQPLICYLASGQKAIVMQRFDLSKYVTLVAKYKIEILFIVPPIAVTLSNSGILREHDVSSVRTIVSSAAPLAKEIEIKLLRMFGKKAKVIQALGLTETTCLAFCVPSFEVKTPCPDGSVGWPLCNTTAKVIDFDTQKPLGPEKRGEICIKNSYLMKGYLNNVRATKQMLDTDGWLHTGDVGYYDKNGFFFVVDRIKELIKYKGYQVAPAELESLLLTHPSVADAAVTSLPDQVAGELPFAWVVRKPNSDLSEGSLHKFVDERVAPYKRLRGGIVFVDQIPKSPSGKILRRLIRQRIPKAKL